MDINMMMRGFNNIQFYTVLALTMVALFSLVQPSLADVRSHPKYTEYKAEIDRGEISNKMHADGDIGLDPLRKKLHGFAQIMLLSGSAIAAVMFVFGNTGMAIQVMAGGFVISSVAYVVGFIVKAFN
jgi:hypothetical protein